MFSGIIMETGRVHKRSSSEEGAFLEITCRDLLPSLREGDSVSVDGVCLTVTRLSQHGFQVDVSRETLRRSNLGSRETGDRLNLEPSLRPTDFMGGHLVQGHVDGTGKVEKIQKAGHSRVYSIRPPAGILAHCVIKGSITINGISLTISALSSDTFQVTIIPRTFQVTNLPDLEVGDLVNLEVDIISKYVEKHLQRYLDLHPKPADPASSGR